MDNKYYLKYIKYKKKYSLLKMQLGGSKNEPHIELRSENKKNQIIYLNKKEALQLELKVNKLAGENYKQIGKFLYHFHSPYHENNTNFLNISVEEYNIIQLLIQLLTLIPKQAQQAPQTSQASQLFERHRFKIRL